MNERPNEMITQDINAKPKSLFASSPRDFLFKYLRYLPWVILSVALFLVLAYLKVRYTVSIFRVQSSMLIKSDNDESSKDQRFQELFMPSGTTNLSNEMEILRSTPVMERVVKDLNLNVRYYNLGNVRSSLLYPDAPFQLDFLDNHDSTLDFSFKISVVDGTKFLLNEHKTPSYFGQIIESGGNHFRILLKPGVNLHTYGSMEFEFHNLSLYDAAGDLIGSLKIVPANEQSTILALSFEGENAQLGKDVLNTLMAVYDTLMVEDKNRIASNTLKFIDDRLLELSDTLKGVEGGLREFMISNQLFDVENQSKSYMDKMDESAKEKSQMDVKVGIADFLLTYISDKKNMYELVPTNLGIEEPALLLLMGEYNRLILERDNNLKTTTPNNPMIVSLADRLDKVRRDIYQALLNVKQSFKISADLLEEHDNQLRGHMTSMPGKSMQFLNKERQQKILEDLYSVLLQKQLEMRLSSASTISNSRVVEPAMGFGTMVSPDKKKIYFAYLIFGLLIPIGIIVILEFLQDSVSGRADVEKHTNTPILGEIGHSLSDQPLVVTLNSRRLIAEQFRIIRTNLQYIIGKKEKPVIIVTSSFSGEGKSFISTNMGAVIALSGKKTVIMEFDIRKPKIVSGLDLKRKMGITNYIIGKASFSELLVKVDGIDGLYVIPCGPIPPNPSELLLDKKLDELMKEVMDYFEVVIMDTAPIGLVSDAANLGRFADTTMYIVRQGYTFRKQLSFIEELYATKKLPGLCLVLNDIKTESGYGTRYWNRYGLYGSYGYGTDSGYFEEEAAKKGAGWFKWPWKRNKKINK